MRTPSLPSIVLLTALPVQAASETTQAPRGPAAGVIVEEVSKGSPAERAGIQPGDRLLSWSRAAATADASPARGEIRSFFDLQDVEVDQVPRGAVTLVGLRRSEPFSVTPPPGEWRMRTRPEMPDRVLTPYLEGRKQIEAKQADEGLGSWRRAIEVAKRGRDHALTCLLLLRMGGALADAARWDEAHAAYRDALETARRARLTLAAARVREAEGKAFEKQGESAKAEAAYLEELKLVEGLETRSLRTARVLSMLAELMDDRPDTGPAKEYYRKTLALREALAPGSLVMADTVNNIGVEAWKEGDYDVAEQNFKRTLAIRESLVPGTAPVAAALNNVGVLAWARGELVSAQELLGKALTIQEGLDPGSKSVADALNNLGLVATDRGDLAAAEDLLKRALRIYEGSERQELDVALALHNVGNVLTLRGELDAAEAFHRRSLAIKERLAPDSLELAFSLASLAPVLQERGELAAAEDLARRGLAIRERLVPDTVEVAVSLSVLGNVLELRGELDAAQDAIRRGVAIEERLAPGGYRLAELLGSAGSILEKRGQLQAAEDLYQRGLAIKARLSPASAAEAQFLHSLGTVCRKTGRAREAADYYRRAVEALEAQRGKLGGAAETRSAFSAKYAQYYKDYIEILLELKDPEGALQVLERSRARALLAMLAERDLVFSDLPADVAREMKLADAEYDRTQAAIAGLNPEKEGEQIERLLGRLRELRQGREQIAAKIRQTSPRLASLQYPAPLDLAGVRSSLDPGSVLLAYSVGKDRTVLFVVEPAGGASRGGSGLSTISVPLGEDALREKVRAFRNLIQRRSSGDRQVLVGPACELYDALVKPAEPLIAQAQRVLISPDGPLHILPFGALMREQPAGRKAKAPSHLVEWKPLHVVVSATVYAELKKSRREPAAPARIAAFGDPKYPAISADPAESVANPELRSVLTRAGAFAPLPFSREEVEGIAGLYPGAAETHLGEQATEEKAKAVGRDVRYLHFACHGLLDERFPLNSALALTIPEKPQEGGDNGLLQAWEIFERIRIEAELVSLSACETGLGKELGGEGLLGLARAFQYAGARSVLASLWSVSDESTAELMKRFYAYLKAGRSKDDALRAAQLELMHSPRTSHPFHWAAFQLLGDWK